MSTEPPENFFVADWEAAAANRAQRAEANQHGHRGFASPDEIAPDPTPDRSHIDTRADAPFVTDFSEPPTIATSQSRRHGQQIHPDLSRRRTFLHVSWFCLAAIVGSAIGLLWFARDAVVYAVPGTAEFYAAIGQPINTRGLDFQDVSYRWSDEDDERPVLTVTGKIRNVSDVALRIPTVVFVLLDEHGDELYNWAGTVRRKPLAAGSEATFSARIPTPPRAARRLRVRFARKSR
ncbi:MAG: DUF3426 domain-containing protein [Hyphomicrobiaceae bacterium]